MWPMLGKGLLYLGLYIESSFMQGAWYILDSVVLRLIATTIYGSFRTCAFGEADPSNAALDYVGCDGTHLPFEQGSLLRWEGLI